MKKKSGLIISIAILVMTIAVYMTNAPTLTNRPKDAGFWMIFAIGAAAGVTLTHLLNSRKK